MPTYPCQVTPEDHVFTDEEEQTYGTVTVGIQTKDPGVMWVELSPDDAYRLALDLLDRAYKAAGR